MLASAINETFPAGVTPPAELRALCDFADEHAGAVSGLFEFDTHGRRSALSWFDNDPEPASEFAVFGEGPDGASYAIWLYAGTDANQAPVVLLGSEGEDSKVIAADFREFLRLLAIGYDEPGQYPTLEPEDPNSAAELRKWIAAEYGLFPPPTAAEMVAAAQSRHPDLLAWIHAWQERHFGSA